MQRLCNTIHRLSTVNRLSTMQRLSNYYYKIAGLVIMRGGKGAILSLINKPLNGITSGLRATLIYFLKQPCKTPYTSNLKGLEAYIRWMRYACNEKEKKSRPIQAAEHQTDCNAICTFSQGQTKQSRLQVKCIQ